MELIVPPDAAPMRLDRFVVAQLPTASRRRVRLHASEFSVNGRPARRNTVVRPGDRITLPDLLASAPEVCADTSIDLRVLYEDGSIIAVDKPSGMSSVALEAGEPQTVASFLASRYPELREVGPALEAGLVHRLDRETSGVILAARTTAAYADLRRQFAEGRIQKEYLALVHGEIASAGSIDLPIAHEPKHPRRMRVCARPEEQRRLRARPAHTRYQPVECYGAATLLRVCIATGVMHQVRVHLAAAGHPVVGDRIYGDDREQHLTAPRHALHACRIEFQHPVTHRTVSVESPTPADLEALTRHCATLARA